MFNFNKKSIDHIYKQHETQKIGPEDIAKIPYILENANLSFPIPDSDMAYNIILWQPPDDKYRIIIRRSDEGDRNYIGTLHRLRERTYNTLAQQAAKIK